MDPLSEGTDPAQGINPAWQEYLNDIPQDHQGAVVEAFKKWDTNVQQQFNQYAPWKDVISSAQPQDVQFALNFVNALENDPALVHKTIGEFYKLTPAEQKAAASATNPPVETDDPVAARLAAIEEQNRILAEYAVSQQNSARDAAQLAQAEQELDRELAALKQKHGEYDELIVLGLLQSGMTAEQAVLRYKAHEEKLVGQYRPKPLFAGAGNGLPATDPKKLDDTGTKNLVVQMLQQAAAERQRG